MSSLHVRPVAGLRGALAFAGDKSIAHRAVILSALTDRTTRISNFPFNQDCLATISVLRKLGVRIRLERTTGTVIVLGRGLRGLKKPRGRIFIRESGTTFRLLLGLLAGQDFGVTLTSGASLSRRPMARVIEPLGMMGAKIRSHGGYPPVTITGGSLHGISYTMPVASAQVKSALLLAGLYAQGATSIAEPSPTRDHTERMLRLFGARLTAGRGRIVLRKTPRLVSPGRMYIPGDISSAAFFIVAALILARSRFLARKVLLNPARAGLIRVLKRMGGRITVTKMPRHKDQGGEPVGDVLVETSRLRGTVVKKTEIPFLIDELPVLMVAAACARGKTVFKDIGELRVKETDRVRSMFENLRAMGVNIKVIGVGSSEDIVVKPPARLKGARLRSFNDHRTAMSMVIAGLAAEGDSSIDDVNCIKKSFPDFLNKLKSLMH